MTTPLHRSMPDYTQGDWDQIVNFLPYKYATHMRYRVLNVPVEDFMIGTFNIKKTSTGVVISSKFISKAKPKTFIANIIDFYGQESHRQICAEGDYYALSKETDDAFINIMCLPIQDVPLYLNDEKSFVQAIAKWRLTINK